jgi:hypothetical protein
VALKADKDKMPGVNDLLKKLGNTATAIPYYAIYSPGWDQPRHFGGNVLTPGKVKTIIEEALEAAGKSPQGNSQQAARDNGKSGGEVAGQMLSAKPARPNPPGLQLPSMDHPGGAGWSDRDAPVSTDAEARRIRI